MPQAARLGVAHKPCDDCCQQNASSGSGLSYSGGAADSLSSQSISDHKKKIRVHCLDPSLLTRLPCCACVFYGEHRRRAQGDNAKTTWPLYAVNVGSNSTRCQQLNRQYRRVGSALAVVRMSCRGVFDSAASAALCAHHETSAKGHS